LCSSSAFDPYILHGNGYKGPKPFVVVLKSRGFRSTELHPCHPVLTSQISGEPATLFESPDDYLHVFALDSAAGIKLMEALFTAKVSSGSNDSSTVQSINGRHFLFPAFRVLLRYPRSPLVEQLPPQRVMP